LEKVKNVTLSKETLDYWKENLSEFYTFFKEKPVEGKEYEDAELKNQITLYRALGLMIASSNSEFSIESSWTETVDSEDVTVKGIKLELKNNNLILNGTGKTKFEDISSNYKLDLSQNSESDQISLIKEIKDSENVYINVCGGGNKLFFIIGNDAPNSWDQKSITDTVILF